MPDNTQDSGVFPVVIKLVGEMGAIQARQQASTAAESRLRDEITILNASIADLYTRMKVAETKVVDTKTVVEQLPPTTAGTIDRVTGMSWFPVVVVILILSLVLSGIAKDYLAQWLGKQNQSAPSK